MKPWQVVTDPSDPARPSSWQRGHRALGSVGEQSLRAQPLAASAASELQLSPRAGMAATFKIR